MMTVMDDESTIQMVSALGSIYGSMPIPTIMVGGVVQAWRKSGAAGFSYLYVNGRSIPEVEEQGGDMTVKRRVIEEYDDGVLEMFHITPSDEEATVLTSPFSDLNDVIRINQVLMGLAGYVSDTQENLDNISKQITRLCQLVEAGL